MAVSSRFVHLTAGVALLFGSVAPALAIDTFTIRHVRGACPNSYFASTHLNWSGRSRIVFQQGEVLRVTLYGHGADFAQDAVGANIHEWIIERNTTDDYPNAPIVAGVKVKKGYVAVGIKWEDGDGLGDRTVTVKWPTGNETIPVRIVANCSEVANATYRTTVAPGSTGITLTQPTTCRPEPGRPCP